MKQGQENFDFIKEEENSNTNFIFQKNTKTKVAFYVIAAILAILILAVVITVNIS